MQSSVAGIAVGISHGRTAVEMIAQIFAFRKVISYTGKRDKTEWKSQSRAQTEARVDIVQRGVVRIDTVASAFEIYVLQRETYVEDEW